MVKSIINVYWTPDYGGGYIGEAVNVTRGRIEFRHFVPGYEGQKRARKEAYRKVLDYVWRHESLLPTTNGIGFQKVVSPDREAHTLIIDGENVGASINQHEEMVVKDNV